jgi:hypothetical protein
VSLSRVPISGSKNPAGAACSVPKEHNVNDPLRCKVGGEVMLKLWIKRNSFLVRLAIPVLFGVVGLATTIVVHFTNLPTDNKFLILIIAILVPSTLSLIVITEVVLLWFYEIWLSGGSDVIVTPLAGAREFAELKRDVIRRIKPGSLNHPIYCTSHCNLFAYPGGRTDEAKAIVKRINEEYFEHVARLSLEQNAPGGLKLLVQYEDSEVEKLDEELRRRIEIFSKMTVNKDFDWNAHHFDIRRLKETSVKDYLVVEDHVFKTIRKTQESKETQYIYIRSAIIAATYRSWLSDLFEFGEGRETEKDKIKERLANLRREYEASRESSRR